MNSSAIKAHGGKAYLASKIIELMPFHDRYCEAYVYSGAVLFAKKYENTAEWINDINGQVTNFWQVLADSTAFKLFVRKVQCTEFGQERFQKAKERLKFDIQDEPFDWQAEVDEALAFFIVNRQSRQALGKDFATPTTRLRRGMNENVSAWLSAVDGLPWFHERLRRVEVWNENAVTFIDKLDKSSDTLFYLDPPYMKSVRSNAANEYGEFEMTDEQHIALLQYLNAGMRGKVIISGYPSPLYNNALRYDLGWRHVDIEIDNKASSADDKEIKIERIWMNYAI